MIKQLIERLEEFKKTAEAYYEQNKRSHVSGEINGLRRAICEAKQLQEKVRCENCKHWGQNKNYNEFGECPTLLEHIDVITRPDFSEVIVEPEDNFYCKFWEEKE